MDYLLYTILQLLLYVLCVIAFRCAKYLPHFVARYLAAKAMSRMDKHDRDEICFEDKTFGFSFYRKPNAKSEPEVGSHQVKNDPLKLTE